MPDDLHWVCLGRFDITWLYLSIRFNDGIIGVGGFVGYKLFRMGCLNGFC